MNSTVTRVDQPHVGLRFTVRRYEIVIPINSEFTCVVSCEHKSNVPLKAVEEPPQVLGSAKYVLPRVKYISHAEASCRCRHQLHHSQSALARYSHQLEA